MYFRLLVMCGDCHMDILCNLVLKFRHSDRRKYRERYDDSEDGSRNSDYDRRDHDRPRKGGKDRQRSDRGRRKPSPTPPSPPPPPPQSKRPPPPATKPPPVLRKTKGQ